MLKSAFTSTLQDFIDNVLYAHRCLANMTKLSQQHEMAIPLEVSDVGVVLDALNTLAEMRLETFADITEKKIGKFAIALSKDHSIALDVSLNTPESGLSGEPPAESQERRKAFMTILQH